MSHTAKRRLAVGVVGVVAAGLLVAGLRTAWGADTDLAAGRPATGSAPCRSSETPAKAVNGSVNRGLGDKFCSLAERPFLQVDLGSTATLGKVIVRHASSGGERAAWNTRDFSLSVSTDGASFTPVAAIAGNTAGTTTRTLTPVGARFLRLEVTRPTGTSDRAARIYALEAYAASKPPTPSPSRPVPSPSQARPTTPTPTTPTPKPTTAAPVACHPDASATVTDYVSHHREAMTRVSCNADVAVYFDAELRALPGAGTAWVTPFATDVWRYMKKAYGACATSPTLSGPIGTCARFGEQKPALFFLHQGKHGGGTVANRFDGFSNFRTTIDVGNSGWHESNKILHDMLVHEACHQVEGASQGVHESPAFPIWGDSKWAEFCLLDFYTNTGRQADADRVLKLFSGNRDNLPAGASNVAWLPDWFKPLWDEGGRKPDVMARYFALLAQHFPKRPENGGKNLIYTRRMNAGEYVLFTSAAAGKDLSGRAAQVFGAGFKRAQFDQARKDFPGVTY